MKSFFLLVGVFATVAFAQGPMGPPGGPPADQIKAYLNLSDSQLQGLQTIRRQEQQAIQPLMQQIGQKHQALQQALQRGSTDAAALGNLLIDTQNLRKQIDQARNSAQTQAINTLNADQKAKLKALEDAQKLMPAVGQATELNLLNPPAGGGPGFGFGFGFGPGTGPGMGPRPFGMGRGPRPFEQ